MKDGSMNMFTLGIQYAIRQSTFDFRNLLVAPFGGRTVSYLFIGVYLFVNIKTNIKWVFSQKEMYDNRIKLMSYLDHPWVGIHML